MNKRTKRVLYGVVASVLIAGSAYGYVYSREQTKPLAGPTVEVQRGRLLETAAASGNIEPAVQIEVKSRTSGQIVEILVKEGESVKKGQLLVRLDPVDAERALAEAKVALERVRSDIVAAQASLVVSEIERKNSVEDEALAQKTADLGLGPKDNIRAASKTSRVAAANVSLRNAQLHAAQLQQKTAELAVQDAETRLKETKIYAPMDGTLLEIPVEVGTIVASALTNVNGGTAIMKLADLTDLRIMGAIDEAQIGRVAADQRVEIRVDAYPDKIFKGKVLRVSQLGKEVSSVVTFDVEIAIEDENRTLLRSGMSADVDIITSEQEDVVLVPLLAVETKGKGRFVRLANGEQRAIKTGATDGTNLVVLDGLAGGEDILASPPAPAGSAKSAQNKSTGMGMMGGPPSGGARR